MSGISIAKNTGSTDDVYNSITIFDIQEYVKIWCINKLNQATYTGTPTPHRQSLQLQCKLPMPTKMPAPVLLAVVVPLPIPSMCKVYHQQ